MVPDIDSVDQKRGKKFEEKDHTNTTTGPLPLVPDIDSIDQKRGKKFEEKGHTPSELETKLHHIHNDRQHDHSRLGGQITPQTPASTVPPPVRRVNCDAQPLSTADMMALHQFFPPL